MKFIYRAFGVLLVPLLIIASIATLFVAMIEITRNLLLGSSLLIIGSALFYIASRCATITLVEETYIQIRTIFGNRKIKISEISFYNMAIKYPLKEYNTITIYLGNPLSFYAISYDPSNKLFHLLKTGEIERRLFFCFLKM